MQSDEDKIKQISGHVAEIMKVLGLDLLNPSLKDTPKRVAKMYYNELFSSLNKNNKPPVVTVFPNTKEHSQLVVEKNILVVSMCEHHFLPIVGKCHIAYLPKKHLIGLSKFHRTVQYFAAKPQLQERLTDEIGEFLQKTAHTKDVAVIVDAVHNCCNIRGPKDINSTTVTSFMGGNFRTGDLRNELFNLLKI